MSSCLKSGNAGEPFFQKRRWQHWGAGQDRVEGPGGGPDVHEDGLGLHQDARALGRGHHQ